MKCKFILQLNANLGSRQAEAAIPGDIVQKRDKEIPRAERYRKLKQSQIIKLGVQRASSTPHHSLKEILCCSCNELYTNRKIKAENALVNYIISAYTQEMLSQSYITAIDKTSCMLGQHWDSNPQVWATAVTTIQNASGAGLP